MKTIKVILVLVLTNLLLSAQTFGDKSTSFIRHDVASFDGATDVWVVDIDNDGFNDIIGTSYNDGICWWENDGQQNFTKHTIADAENAPGARTLRVFMHDGSILDFNGDGFVDIASAEDPNRISFWLNDGIGNFTRTIIDETSYGSHTVDVIDLDKDGDIDILACSFGTETQDGEFAIYYNDGSLGFAKETLHKTVETCGTFIHSGDIDGDGMNDILFTEYHWQNPSDLGWYKTTETGREKITIDSFMGFHTGMLKDYDKDGDLDILAAAYNGCKFFIYTNDGAGNFTKTWEMTGIGAIWLDMADFDNDGDIDLVGAAQNSSGSPDVYWIENNGNFTFSSHALAPNISEVYCAIPSDLDKDGDQDIIIMSNANNKVIWWENRLITTGINIQDDNNEFFDIYPNPSSGSFNVSLTNDYHGDVNIQIFNISGTLVYSNISNKTDKTFQFKLENKELAAGFYLLNLRCGSNTYEKKLIITK